MIYGVLIRGIAGPDLANGLIWNKYISRTRGGTQYRMFNLVFGSESALQFNISKIYVTRDLR